jgi:glutamine cyclotransferase
MKNVKRNGRYLAAFMLGSMLIVVSTIIIIQQFGQRPQPQVRYSYEIINVYPHDPEAFTEGLVFDDGVLYEGTGLYGRSTLRRVELKTGRVLQAYALPDDVFGEGVTIFGDEIIQLTWLQHRGFVRDKQTFELLKEFSYATEGWGLTNNGSHLIMSDGTANLYFLDPGTFEVVGQLEVRDEQLVTGLNELEYIKGEVYANVWHERLIARIDPKTGEVRGWVDLSNIVDYGKLGPEDVLNGIAYNAEDDVIYVTGKRWTQLFEIRLIPMNQR